MSFPAVWRGFIRPGVQGLSFSNNTSTISNSIWTQLTIRAGRQNPITQLFQCFIEQNWNNRKAKLGTTNKPSSFYNLALFHKLITELCPHSVDGHTKFNLQTVHPRCGWKNQFPSISALNLLLSQIRYNRIQLTKPTSLLLFDKKQINRSLLNIPDCYLDKCHQHKGPPESSPICNPECARNLITSR